MKLLLRGLLILTLSSALPACGAVWPLTIKYGTSDEGPKPLRVALVKNHFSKFSEPGFVRELLNHFARDHHYQLKYKIWPTEEAALASLRSGEADIAAGSFAEDLAEPNEAHMSLHIDLGRFLVRPSKRPPKDSQETSYQISYFVRANRTDVELDLAKWYHRSSSEHDLQNLTELYSSHLASLDWLDQDDFLQSLQDKLPALLPSFKKIGAEFNLPWQLVAAVAYQESHWDHQARSFTGVKGLMMLTKVTADHLGVQDRTDLQQSLWGGSKYLRFLLNHQPKFLSERERIAFALASYNVGPAHVEDAQLLASRLGKNPYSWKDLKKVLPMLSYPEYYEQLEHGEARGQEPLDFSSRVLAYYEILGASGL